MNIKLQFVNPQTLASYQTLFCNFIASIIIFENYITHRNKYLRLEIVLDFLFKQNLKWY